MAASPPQLPQIQIPLRDGSVAEVRPLAPEDRPLLVEGLSRMSEQSRFARFGSGISNLSEAELRYLTEVDQVSHVAWGAIIDGEPAGVGRYILGADTVAEIAITVVDQFQRRGLGTVLFEALVASARASGIEEFRFSIEPWNRSVPRMLPGVDFEIDEVDGMLTGRVEIAKVPPGAHEKAYVELLDRCRQGWPAG
jgi:GNAT superfamily N-acetyltransferase